MKKIQFISLLSIVLLCACKKQAPITMAVYNIYQVDEKSYRMDSVNRSELRIDTLKKEYSIYIADSLLILGNLKHSLDKYTTFYPYLEDGFIDNGLILFDTLQKNYFLDKYQAQLYKKILVGQDTLGLYEVATTRTTTSYYLEKVGFVGHYFKSIYYLRLLLNPNELRTIDEPTSSAYYFQLNHCPSLGISKETLLNVQDTILNDTLRCPRFYELQLKNAAREIR